jgi:hypothetical protein
MEDFNKFFKESFEKLGLEISEVSRAFCVNHQTIRKWMDGIYKPRPFVQKQIVEWFERRLRRKERIDKNAEAISEDDSGSN